VTEPSDVKNTLALLTGILDELKNIKIQLARQDERIRGISRSFGPNVCDRDSTCELVRYKPPKYSFNRLLKKSETQGCLISTSNSGQFWPTVLNEI
jgi:hypothetical protein